MVKQTEPEELYLEMIDMKCGLPLKDKPSNVDLKTFYQYLGD